MLFYYKLIFALTSTITLVSASQVTSCIVNPPDSSGTTFAIKIDRIPGPSDPSHHDVLSHICQDIDNKMGTAVETSGVGINSYVDHTTHCSNPAGTNIINVFPKVQGSTLENQRDVVFNGVADAFNLDNEDLIWDKASFVLP